MITSDTWGVVAIIRLHQRPPDALFDALIEGGVHTLEVTLSTPGSLDLIARWRGTADCRIGVGTIRSTGEASDAINAGAEFLVTPTTQPSVIEAATGLGVPLIVGAMTPTEIDTAWHLGANAVKVFPVEAIGGPKYIKALQGPIPDVPLLPTGGVDPDSTRVYAELRCAGVGVGSALVDQRTVGRGGWTTLTERATALTQAWDAARGGRELHS